VFFSDQQNMTQASPPNSPADQTSYTSWWPV